MSLYSNSSMDPQKSHLGKELLQEISPVVMVLSSSLAEESCQKNGLSLVEMLLPFSVFNRIDVPVRTASDQPYRLQMFRLRLAYSSDIRQISYEAAEDKLKKVVYDASQMVPDLKSDPPQLESILNKSESDYYPSWIQAFNKELIQSVSYSEHEAFDHPVACLLAVSSKEELPINRFIDLFNTSRLPSLLNNGAMDPKILKHYLLIHDNQDDQAEKATNVLTEMRNTFGLYGCKLLCINSAKDMSDKLGENPWADIKTKVSDSQEIGSCLSIDDLNGIKECMQDITTKHIIPHMEQKIRILNQQVSATRKGFKNQIKNLWWRKGKEDTPETPIGPTYTFNSIESQIRVLGDYAFMLRDYELALSNYRLLSTDYKLDKAWKRYAGIQEMMGLTFFMLDQSRKEAEYCMETAFTTYLRLGPSGQRNATRCGLWWADMLKFRRQYKDAAGIYFRISIEEPSLHAAVRLEQAAYCYLFSEPRMLRKYAFHLVLAGNRYFMSNQREHAIHMYRNALSVYKGRAWNYINDHVHFNIGRWYAFLGIPDVAIKHMLEILACSHQSLSTQDLFLKDFFQIVEKLGKMHEVNKLQLPIIDMNSYKVIYEDHRTYASPTNANVRESLWQALEEDMVPSTYNAKFNWLESKNSSVVKDQNSQVCIVGEAIKLDIEFKNPLHIPLSVSSISLICELGANSKVAESDKSSPTRSQDGEPSEHPSCSEVNNDDSHVMSPQLDIVLEGGQTKKIQLSITPKTEGILKILGVRWKISELVFGYQYFESEQRRKHRKGKKYQTHSSNYDLTFIVIKGLPKLDGRVRNLPQKSFVGELKHLKLELRNPSEYTLKNIKMKISHPRFLIPGCSEDMDKDFPNCLDSHISSERKTNQPDVLDNSDSVLFFFPTDTMIQGGATFVWPLWFHTGISGKISLYISVYYEMEGSFGDMKYRLLRMHSDVEVLPSLDVSFSITPCPTELQEYMVRMDIVNKATSSSFSLQQLSCIGDHWEISTLPKHSTIFPSQVLHAGQELSSFFRLKDCEKGTSKQSEIVVRRNDTLLGATENVEKLIDISKTPLADFHRHERHKQGISAKGNRNNIDFILISKLQEDGSNPSSVGSKLLSHHISHCSFNSRSPISYLMMGPKTTTHDFLTSFCEVALQMKIHNLASYPVSIKITTYDSIPAGKTPESSGSSGGWHEVQLASEVKATSDVLKVSSKKSTVHSISPFVWCASSCTQINVGPECTVEKPLRVCLFSPGVYDLSNYEVHWKIEATDEVHGNIKKNISGMGYGHPFCITALQSSSLDVE